MADSTHKILTRLLTERILIMDGAMGTMIQGYDLDEDAYRGERFADHPKPKELQGQQRFAVPHPTAGDRGNPPRVPPPPAQT